MEEAAKPRHGSRSARHIFPAVFAIAVILSLPGCSKKSGEAIVLEKEHIAAREVRATPASETSTSPTKSAENEGPLALAKNEIVVDEYVMDRDARGTSRDPRAGSEEQWIVKVRLVEGGRQFNVQADKTKWEKLKPGDRIKVAYREGKYTGTVWGAEIQ
jgi:hypothetical protein